MRHIFSIMFALGVSINLFAASESASKMRIDKNMKLKITVGDQIITATLYDNPTCRDFLALLPLTLELTDYASTEKISNLPEKLSTKDAPAGSAPDPGDIAYYAPWGNLALFYKDFKYSPGLIKIAKIDNEVKAFGGSAPVTAKIEVTK